ncbi:MAG: FecR domain-containing protein [Bacteroidales bacterium]|nr:FecR domain-containing protein [Bacteroidales bacterium]
MSDFEDKHMDFVLTHYQEGKFDTQKALQRFNEAHGIVRKPRRRVLPWVSGVAAAAAAVILCVFLFRDNEQQILLMADAQAKEFVLPDGTEVTLAPGSKLTYSEKSPRNTALEGKAYFEVARDEAVPFEITSDGAFVRVLGTKFMVDAGSSVKEVYVTEGKVLFAKSSDSEGVILTKDMQATLSESDAVPVVAMEPDVNSIAWQRGSFIFDKTPLKDVLETLSEHYRVSFAATDLDKQLSGEFYAEDLDLIISLIESALDVHIIKR